jgi:hypothetical protein
MKIKEEDSSLFTYSSIYLLQYRKDCVIEDNQYLGLFQRKFQLILPEDFKKLSKNDESKKVLDYVQSIEAKVHFYTIRGKRDQERYLDRKKYIFYQTKNLNPSLEGLPESKLKKVISYYSRICRSSFYLNHLEDSGVDYELKALEEKKLIKVSF